MIDPDVYKQFCVWYRIDVAGDDWLGNTTPDEAIAFAIRHQCLDRVLLLETSGESMREFLSINFVPLAGVPHGVWCSMVPCSGSPLIQT